MKTHLVFEKMHGAGNDFVLIDNRVQKIALSKENIVSLAHRHTGIGFDQILLIDTSEVAGCNAAYRFFNPDGSEAEQCGNGQRCISKYLNWKNPKKTHFKLSGLAGVISSEVLANGQVQVNMGAIQQIDELSIQQHVFTHVSYGNPHLVGKFANLDDCNLIELNKKYTTNYPQGINFEIVEIISPAEIKLRVHERGTGETLACGSGACAAVAALQDSKQLNNKVKVILPGGTLMVEYHKEDKNHYLSGPAEHVFTGVINGN